MDRKVPTLYDVSVTCEVSVLESLEGPPDRNTSVLLVL